MRVISGYLRSRVINVAKQAGNVRPTTDRARETLFNIISNQIDFHGCRILDLFAGSGSFGIECISRGAEQCVFVDTFTGSVKINMEALELKDKSEIIKSDSLVYLKNNVNEKFDIIFADPPYAYRHYEKLLEAVKEYGTYFILEHSDKFGNINGFEEQLIKTKKIGITSFSFYNFGQNEDNK